MSESPAAFLHVEEHSGYVDSGGGSVYCTTFLPRETDGRTATLALFVGAFAEERKASVRPIVEMARSLAHGGMPCARIDFRGTGDSSGESTSISLESMVADVVSSAEALAPELRCSGVALVGLRLGAAIAHLAAARLKPLLRAAVLMEPVISGETYARELMRKQAIRKMLTKGSAAGEGEGASNDGPFDLDGLGLDRTFLDELSTIDLNGSVAACRTLLVQIGARRTLRPAMAKLAAALGAEARAEVLVAEPFWLQTEYVDPAPAIEVVRGFVRDACNATPPTEGGADQ